MPGLKSVKNEKDKKNLIIAELLFFPYAKYYK